MSEQDTIERKNTERIFARGFTIIGGVFWIGTAFFGPYIYQGQDFLHAMLGRGIYPLIFTAAVLAIGWFYERLAALILALGAVGTIAWGVIMGWDPFVWGIMLAFFVSPTVVAAVLYYLAGNVKTVEGERTAAA